MPIHGIDEIDTSRTGGPIRPLAKPRGLPAEFATRVLFETEDPGMASNELRVLFGDNLLRVATEGVPIRLHGVRLPAMSLSYLDCQADIVLDAPRLPAHQLVITPTSGIASLTAGGHEVDATPFRACCPRPGESLRLVRTAGDPLMIIMVEQDTLRRGVDALLGRSFVDAVTFDVEMDLAHDGAERWQSALQLVHSEVARAGHDGSFDVALMPLQAYLVATLLLTHGSNCHDALHRATSMRHTQALRRVVRHIEEHLQDPLGVTDLAEVAGVSVRTLQTQFRDSFDQTPTQYIRDRRLDRVHADLRQADGSTRGQVGRIAGRWGFEHEGRFAAAYRRRFGERPSDTLRR